MVHVVVYLEITCENVIAVHSVHGNQRTILFFFTVKQVTIFASVRLIGSVYSPVAFKNCKKIKSTDYFIWQYIYQLWPSDVLYSAIA